MLRPLLDLRAAVTQGEGVGRYSLELARALDGRSDVALRYFAPTWARPSLPPGEMGLAGSGFAPRLPSKVLCAVAERVGLGVESLVRGGVDVVHHTQYRRLPTRRPEVATIHDLVYLDSDRFVGRATADRMSGFARWAAREAHAIVTPSQAVAAEVVERLQVDPARVVPAHLGIDHALRGESDPEAAERVAAEVAARGPFLLTAARIEPRKNHAAVLAALESLGSAAPRWVVVGPEGDGAADFHAALERSSVRARVELRGRVGEDELRARLDACAAFVLVPHDEGFGLAPLEAAARGCPVVTSDVPVVREVCSGAATLVPPDDVDGIARALQGALQLDGAEREARGEVARRFTWAACAARHLEAYRTAVARCC